MKCLFHQENKDCSERFSDEHIIQEGLGGSLTSNEIICHNCNQYFSKELDEIISSHYRPILHHLSPIMSGSLKNKKFKVDTSNGLDLKIKAGSKSLYQKIHKEFDENDKLKSIVIPPDTDELTVKQIFESHGVDYNTVSRRNVPLTKALGIDEIFYNNDVDYRLISALLNNNLELFRYFTIKENLPDLLLHKNLSVFRSIARNNKSYFNKFPGIFPNAPVNHIIDSLFSESIFSHRFIISYDYEKRALIFLSQYVNTMPWIFVIEECELYHRTFSFLYKKALLGGGDETRVFYKPVVDINEVLSLIFKYSNQDEVLAIGEKYNEVFKFQYARAIYELDMRHDGAIENMMDLSYEEANDKSIDHPEIMAIISLINNRYACHSFLNDIIEYSQNELIGSPLNINQSLPIVPQLFKPYRDLLAKIVRIEKFGYPSTISSYSISNGEPE